MGGDLSIYQCGLRVSLRRDRVRRNCLPAGRVLRRGRSSAWELPLGGRGRWIHLRGAGVGRYSLLGPERPWQTDAPTGDYSLVKTGREFACALGEAGGISCWGDNEYGQADPPAGIFRSLSAGHWHACAVRESGEVECWGQNYSGEGSPPAGSFQSVSADYQHSCGIRDTGEVACWGWNDYGQATAPSGSYLAVSTGYYHTCGVQESGEMRCWGLWHEYSGEYGVGEQRFYFGDRTYRAVSAGFRQTCTVRDTGEINCWGEDLYRKPRPPAGSFVAVSTGWDARLRDSRVGRTRVLGRERSGQGSSGASLNP